MAERELDLDELAAGESAGNGAEPDKPKRGPGGRFLPGGGKDKSGGSSSTRRKRTTRRTSSSSSGPSRVETEIHSRVERVISRLIENREGRGDEELAQILREDGDTVAGSIAQMTRPFPPLRQFVIVALAIVEPLIAFGRIGRVLASRWGDRRTQAAAAQQAAVDDYYREHPEERPPDYVEPQPAATY